MSKYNSGSGGTVLAGIVIGVLGLALLGFQWYATDFALKQNLTTPLARVSNASNVTVAAENLEEALSYMDRTGLTSGNSSYFLNDRENDIGYFHTNLQKSLVELKTAQANKNLSQLEESNLLIRVKEVVNRQHKDGGVFLPDHLSYYPRLYGNLFLFIFGWIIAGVGSIVFRVGLGD